MAAIFVALLLVLPPFSSQPASAAAPALQIVMAQTADAEIGTPATYAAHVEWSGNAEELEPPDGWYVNFHGTADGGWDSGPIQAVNHEARYTRTSRTVQTETVTATIANTGCTVGAATDTITHRWWQPTITIDQPKRNVATALDAEFPLTGTVTRDGVGPVANAAVTASVLRYTQPPGSYLPSFDPPPTATTDSAGRFSVSWSNPPPIEGPLQPGIEAVYVSATADGGTFSANTATSHSWTVTPLPTPLTDFTVTAAEEARVGDAFPVTARYPTSSEVSPPPEFGFATGTGWQNPNPPASTTGTSTVTYNSATAAGWLIRGARWEATGPHAGHATRFYQPEITFREPDSSTSDFGTYRSSVIVTDGDGTALPDIDVTFYDGETAIGTDTTDANGIATSDPLIRTPGTTLNLRAREVNVPSGNTPAVDATTQHSWVSTPLGLNMQLNNVTEGFESRVGTNETFRAHLDFDSEGADNLQGWDVRFTIDGDLIGTRVTNTDGNASVTTTRTTQSFSYIQASVNIAGCGTITRTNYHEWWRPAVDLQPNATTSLARTTQTFTAELSRPPASETGGDRVERATPKQLNQLKAQSASAERKIAKQADRAHTAALPGWETIPGALIRFTLTSTSCELPVAVREATTNQAGIATASFTRSGPTIDRVRATEVGVTAPQSDTTTHTWGAPPNPPISVTLTQSSTKSDVGGTVKFTATVHDSDRPGGLAPAGTEVVFHGISPNRTRTTDSNGQADFSYSSDSTSPTTVTATSAYGCGVVESDPVTHDWERPSEPSTPPPSTPPPTVIVTTPPPAVTTPPPNEPTPDEPTQDESTPPELDETSETPPPPPPKGLPATSKLVDGPEVGRPGADIEISGNGCKAGESLTVSLGETQLGQTQAAADGTFYVRAVVPNLPLGRYVINSSCGKTIGDPNVDITSPQVDKARAGIAAAGLTTASTFAFFVLLVKGVISFLPRRPV